MTNWMPEIHFLSRFNEKEMLFVRYYATEKFVFPQNGWKYEKNCNFSESEKTSLDDTKFPIVFCGLRNKYKSGEINEKNWKTTKTYWMLRLIDRLLSDHRSENSFLALNLWFWIRIDKDSYHIQFVKDALIWEREQRCVRTCWFNWLPHFSRKIFFFDQLNSTIIIELLNGYGWRWYVTQMCSLSAHTPLCILSQRLIPKNGLNASVMEFSFPLLIIHGLHFQLSFIVCFRCISFIKICVSF